MPQRLFHRTTIDEIPAILSDGFRDGDDDAVWFSTALDDRGASGRRPVEAIVEMTDEELAAYAVEGVADEEWDEAAGDWKKSDLVERFVWYKIPATVVNPRCTRRELSAEEVRRFDLE